MTEQERFIVSIDNKNGVGLYDGDIRLLYFQFNNIQDATECKDALKHQCSLMNELHEENEELKQENEELKQSIDNMGGRLQGLWAHYNANRYEIWGRAVEDVAKELGFKIYKPGDAAISMSDLKKERINNVKKLNNKYREGYK